eukprot:COSAG02_NODE_32911_length_508_cov_1.249389_1_plen_87_part_01
MVLEVVVAVEGSQRSSVVLESGKRRRMGAKDPVALLASVGMGEAAASLQQTRLANAAWLRCDQTQRFLSFCRPCPCACGSPLCECAR